MQKPTEKPLKVSTCSSVIKTDSPNFNKPSTRFPVTLPCIPWGIGTPRRYSTNRIADLGSSHGYKFEERVVRYQSHLPMIRIVADYAAQIEVRSDGEAERDKITNYEVQTT